MDLEEQLRTSYADVLDDLDLPPVDVGDSRRAGARMRTRRRAAAGLAVLAVVAGGAFLKGGDGSAVDPSDGGGHWHQLPGAPLSPRTQSLVVWTGDELVVMGGAVDSCPAGSDYCVASGGEGLVRDDAVYDPTSGQWRKLPLMPRAVLDGQAAVAVDGHVFVDTNIGDWYDLDLAHARWSTIATPWPHGGEMDPGMLTADDGHVYTYEHGRVYSYTVGTGRFDTLPVDPLQPTLSEAALTSTTSGLVLTGRSSEAEVPSTPNFVLADVWDGSHWRRLPPTGQVSTEAGWSWTGKHMVAPDTYSSSGDNAREHWGRSYPQGGVLDPATGAWSPLPADLIEAAGQDCPYLFTSTSTGPWVLVCDAAYDDATGTVHRLGPVPDTLAFGAGSAWAGDRLMAFGGATHPPSGTVGPTGQSNQLWVWTP